MDKQRQNQFIEVGVETERYAISINAINEIIRIQDITKVPGSKTYVHGVINLRGTIVPVIGLRQRFGMPEQSYNKETRIVVVNYDDNMVGIVVDKVNKVAAFTDIQPAPDHTGSSRGSFCSGIGKTDNGLVSILKLDQVLNG
jgi:purine-binding chemotaxis protein CheW